MKMAAYNERSTDFEVNISSNALEQENRIDMAEQSYCDPCNRDGKQNKTTGFCVDCNEHLCTSCFNLHKKFKPLQHHVLLDRLGMLQRKTSEKVKDICVDKCPSHEDRIIEYICQSCDKLCCSVCIINGHRQCEKVDFIPDIIEDIEKSKVFVDVNQAIKDQSVLLNKHDRNCGINKDLNKKLRDTAKEVVKIKCNEIHTWLMENEKEMMSRIEVKYNEEQQRLDNFSTEVTTLKDNIGKVKSSLTTKKNSSQRCHLFVALQKAKLTTNEICRRLKELEKVEEIQKYHFKETAYIHDIKSQIELGTVERISSDSKKELRFLHSIDRIKMGYPGKMCMISETILILRECSLETLSLDLSRKEGPVLFVLHLNSKPADITNVSEIKEGKVAVTFPEDGVIIFYDVTTAGCVAGKKTIHVGKYCQGIQYYKNNLIVSYFHNRSGSVSIIDMSGQHIKEIVGSSTLVFQIPVSLALNPLNELLYVADMGDGTVSSLTLDGTVVNKYKSEVINCGLYGISTDENGSLYACYACSGTMIQLSEKLSFIKKFDIEPLSYLHAIFSEKTNFMYASTFSGVIEVFEII